MDSHIIGSLLRAERRIGTGRRCTGPTGILETRGEDTVDGSTCTGETEGSNGRAQECGSTSVTASADVLAPMETAQRAESGEGSCGVLSTNGKYAEISCCC
jgi:hypothetical protein